MSNTQSDLNDLESVDATIDVLGEEGGEPEIASVEDVISQAPASVEQTGTDTTGTLSQDTETVSVNPLGDEAREASSVEGTARNADPV